MCRGTARHERMTESRSPQPIKVTEKSQADGLPTAGRPAADGWPHEHSTRQQCVHQTYHETSPARDRLVTAVRPATRRRLVPDVTQTPHTDFHHTHGIRHTNDMWSPALCGSTNIKTNADTKYAEIHCSVESSNTLPVEFTVEQPLMLANSNRLTYTQTQDM